MKQKKFSLQAILKLREYKEHQELQIFSNTVKEDNVMIANIAECSKQQAVFGESLEGETDFYVIKEVHEIIASYEKKKRFFVAEREKTKILMKKAKKEYDQAYKNAESIRILKNTHVQKQNKEKRKKYMEEIQEQVTCQE